MNRKELVAALEEHLWPQLTLVKVAGMGARCSGYAPEIGFGLPFSCGFPDGDDGQRSGAGIEAGHDTAGLNLASLRLPGLPPLPEGGGDPLVKFTKQPQANFPMGTKG